MESTENNQPAKETFEWWYISNDKDFPVIKNQVGLRQFNLAEMEKAWTASADNSNQKTKELEDEILELKRTDIASTAKIIKLGEKLVTDFKKIKELEAKLALAEGEWKTYAKSCESLSKKLAEAQFVIDSRPLFHERKLDEKLKVAVEALKDAESCIKGALRRFDNGCHVLYLGDTYLKIKAYESKYLKKISEGV